MRARGAFHAALDAVPEDASGRRAGACRAARAPPGRRPSSSTSRRSSPASGDTSKASRATRSSAERRRYEQRWRDALPRGGRVGRPAHGPRRGCCDAARALGRELGVHVARARPRHRRARRPLHGDPRRRHPRLRDAAQRSSRVSSIVNPFASGVDEHRLAAVQAALPAETETRLTTCGGRGNGDRAGGGRGRCDLRPRRRRDLQRGPERARGGRPARLPTRWRHERAAPRARPSARSGERSASVSRSGRTRRIGLGRVNGRRFVVQRGRRVRRRARPPGRRARAQSRRAAPGRRRVHAGGGRRPPRAPRAVRRGARDRGRGPGCVRPRRELLALHVCGRRRARPRPRRETSTTASAYVAPGEPPCARSPTPRGARRRAARR